MRSSFHRFRQGGWSVLAVLLLWGSGERGAWAGPAFGSEAEPNNTAATATPIAGTSAVFRGTGSGVSADVDYYSFTAAAGDRVYAAVQTAFSALGGGSFNCILELVDADGTTVLEGDDNDGSFSGSSPSIANVQIPAAGTYFLRARSVSRVYHLHFRLRSGSPAPETEPNDAFPGQALPASGWVSGSTSAAADVDLYSLDLEAGDTVYLSLDLDPERDGDWNGQLGLVTPGGAILAVDDPGIGAAPYTAPDSEAFFLTVKAAGTYGVFVGVPGGATPGTYTLSVSVYPRATEGVNCTTYTSTDVPKAIPDGGGSVSSAITVPGNPRIADLDVTLQLSHTRLQDLDVHLVSPAGNDNGLFSDVFNDTAGGPSAMDLTLDDEAAIPPSFAVAEGLVHQPEPEYRLWWFDGEDAGGIWTLVLRDDAATNSGTLAGWSLTLCEPAPEPACAPGSVPAVVFSTDFEGGAAGFVSTGSNNEWQLGLPTTAATGIPPNPVAAFTTCNSGTSCWKTDLDSTYFPISLSSLRSPAVGLAGFLPPVLVRWAHRYQVNTSRFDSYDVDIRQAGLPATGVPLFSFRDEKMTDQSVGAPLGVHIGASAGWGLASARADAFAGQNVELLFELASRTNISGNLGGVAIDDVSITACRPLDLAIAKTDGVAAAVPGGAVTYTITASNADTDAVIGATVADTFPAILSCTWTCAGAGGGTCTAAGSGDIDDTVDLPAGGSVTYTASCAIPAAATGTLSNTATVAGPGGMTDPTPADNSATDTDVLTPAADLAIVKTDGVTTAAPGGSVTYTITASNSGPSDAPGATVVDAFPASLSCTWTCAGAGGGTCTAAGAGPIGDTVNLPAGGSVTYAVSCAVSAAASGTLSNTATVAAPSGATDPNPGNDSATDTDTLVPSADLAITKTDGVAAATPGGSLTYTIAGSNAGPSDAPGATVADTFPADLACTWTCAGAGGGTCTAAGAGDIADTVDLPAGGSVTYTASCSVSAAATGTLSNTATVAVPAGVTDPAPGNDSATDTDTLAVQADLAVTKTDGVTTATPGGSTTYAITASNAGPSSITGATVADAFPASLTCAWTCAGAGGGTCTAAGAGDIDDTVDLPAGGSVTYTASCSISAAATGTLSNTATVAVPAGATDPDPANDSATDTDTLTPAADLAITKTDGVTTAAPGGSVTYTLTASNAGPSDVPGATVADVLPASLTCAWTCAGAGGGTCTAAGSGDIADTVGLPAGGSVTYAATCTLDLAATGTLTNTATVSAPAGVTDPDPTNDSAADTDTLAPTADLSITKTDGIAAIDAGGAPTYTITAANAGPSDAPGAMVTDPFPASLTCTWTCAGAGGGTCTAAGSGDIADTVGLPAGGSVTYTASCALDLTATGTLTNTATVSAPAGVTDPDPGNDSAADTDTIVQRAAVSGTKTASGTFVPGGTVVYTITLGNTGGAQADNPGDELVDVLPPQLALVSASATSGTAVADPGSNTVTWNGAIPSGDSVTIVLSAGILPGAAGSTVSNQATLRFDADGDGTNESSTTTDDPGTAGAGDPTTFAVAPASVIEVPTLAPLGFLLLAAVLAAVALLKLRQG